MLTAPRFRIPKITFIIRTDSLAYKLWMNLPLHPRLVFIEACRVQQDTQTFPRVTIGGPRFS